MKRHIFLGILLIAFTFATVSCGTEPMPEPQEKEPATIELGEEQPIPYTLDNMQESLEKLAMEKFGPSVTVPTLEENFLYARFQPENRDGLAFLQAMDVEFFDYPLHCKVKKWGNVFGSQDLKDRSYPWYYAVVPAASNLNDISNVRIEVLERCHIPAEQDVLICTDPEKPGEHLTISAGELERRAFDNVGFILGSGTRANAGSPQSFKGRIRVLDDSHNELVGVKGVKIRCRLSVKTVTTYTDENGNYEISGNFTGTPFFSVVFENKKDFSIWYNASFINAAVHNFGEQEGGASHDFTKGVEEDTEGWRCCIINNSTYDYYAMCVEEGILLPPKDLKIWCWTFTGSSSASMIRNVAGSGEGWVDEIIIGFIMGLAEGDPAEVKTKVANFILHALPDLTIGVRTSDKYNTYKRHYCTTWHELTHSSHYSQAGNGVWGKYIDYIVENFGYGDASTPSSVGKDICGLGESWAYSNQRLRQKEMFNDDSSTLGSSNWFYPLYEDLYDKLNKGVWTTKQVYDCLLPEVTSYDAVKERLSD